MAYKVLALLAILVSSALTFPAEAAYLVHLESGGRLRTPLYWEEGRYIQFLVAGGTMGIEKSGVRGIEMVPDGPRQAAPVAAPLQGARATSPDAPPPRPAPLRKAAAPPADRDQAIVDAFTRLSQRYERRDGLSVDQLRVLKADLTELRERIVSDRVKYDFIAEVNQLADMRFFVNDLILIRSTGR